MFERTQSPRREELKAVAAETLAILDAGSYTAPSGRTIDISGNLARQAVGTTFHPSGRPVPDTGSGQGAMAIEVTDEDSVTAIVNRAGLQGGVCCLVFASARRPGGGFIDGATAQEECLARASTLFRSQAGVRGFYDPHGEDPSYTDAMIHTADALLFRDAAGSLLEEPVPCSFLTSAAPNAGAMADNRRGDFKGLPRILLERIERMLGAMAAHGERNLVLGAWGCGVFRNEPPMVARAFKRALTRHQGFDRVTFAIPDSSSPQHAAFAEEFGLRPSAAGAALPLRR